MELLRMAYALRRECTHVPAWALSARGTPLEIMHSRLTLTEVLLRLLETHHAIAIKRIHSLVTRVIRRIHVRM